MRFHVVWRYVREEVIEIEAESPDAALAACMNGDGDIVDDPIARTIRYSVYRPADADATASDPLIITDGNGAPVLP